MGLAPNPYLRANMARSVSVALLLVFIISTLLFLLSSRFGVAHQSVNVRLDRDDLLHIPSRLLIFSIELFFLCCELTALSPSTPPFWGPPPPSRQRLPGTGCCSSLMPSSCSQEFPVPLPLPQNDRGVAGHDSLAILTGTDNSGLGHALVLDAGHHSSHFFIVPDFKGMVLEGVELVQLDIDDLFLAPAWSILRFFGFLRSGSGLYRWSRFFSGSFLTAFSGFCAGVLGFGAAALSLSAFGDGPGASAVPALWVFPPLFSEPPAAFPVSPLLPGQAFPRRELPPVPRLSFPS